MGTASPKAGSDGTTKSRSRLTSIPRRRDPEDERIYAERRREEEYAARVTKDARAARLRVPGAGEPRGELLGAVQRDRGRVPLLRLGAVLPHAPAKAWKEALPLLKRVHLDRHAKVCLSGVVLCDFRGK